MNDKQKTVLDLAAKAQLISPEMKSKIQIGISHLSEEQLSKVSSILKEALQKQQEILMKEAVKKNPELISDMKQIIKEEAHHDLEEREASEQEAEMKDFNFDSELESVFNNVEK